MKQSIRLMIIGLLLVVFLVVSAGCGGKKPESIKLASVSPKTGPWATYGHDQRKGMEVAIEVINEAGGISQGPFKGVKFEIEVFDDRGDPKESANIAQKLVADESIFAMVGPTNSSCALADAPILEKGGVTMVTDLATTPELTNQGYERVFRTYFTGITEGKAMAMVALETLGLKRMYVFYENTDYGAGIQGALVPAMEDGAGEVLGVDAYTPGQDTDFSPLITKARNAGAEVIGICGSYNESGLIIRQVRTAGWDVPIVICTGNNHPNTIELAGAENLYNAYFTSPPVIGDSTDPNVVAFREKFEEKFGEKPGDYTAYAYDAVMVIKEAIELGCQSRDELHTYLRKIENYQGLTGPITFDEGGDVMQPGIVLLAFENGEYVLYE